MDPSFLHWSPTLLVLNPKCVVYPLSVLSSQVCEAVDSLTTQITTLKREVCELIYAVGMMFGHSSSRRKPSESGCNKRKGGRSP